MSTVVAGARAPMLSSPPPPPLSSASAGDEGKWDECEYECECEYEEAEAAGVAVTRPLKNPESKPCSFFLQLARADCAARNFDGTARSCNVNPNLHAKLYMVDRKLVFIGSQNPFSSDLAQFNVVTENASYVSRIANDVFDEYARSADPRTASGRTDCPSYPERRAW